MRRTEERHASKPRRAPKKRVRTFDEDEEREVEIGQPREDAADVKTEGEERGVYHGLRR